MNVYQGIKEEQRGIKRDALIGAGPTAPLGLKDLVQFILRRRMIIVSVGWLVACVVFSVSMLQTPKYTASAIVMISPQQEKVVTTEQVVDGVTPDFGLVDSQIPILKSRKIYGQLVDRLRLVDDPNWNDALRKPSILSFFSGGVQKQNIDVTREKVITKVAKRLDAKRQGLTYVIELTAQSTSPSQAAAMANTMVDLYLESQLQMRFSAGQKASAWLSTRLTSLKTELQQKEAAVEDYRAATGLLTSEGASLTEQQITDLQTSVMAAKTDLAEREARYRQVQQLLQAGSSVDSIAGAISSETIRDLRAQEADVARRQADLESRYSEIHPSVQKVREERSGIEAQIKAEIGRISTNLKNEVEVARTRLATLQGSQSSVKQELVTNNAGMVKLRELERGAAATRAMYENFLKRFQEVSEFESLKTTDARLIAEATKPLKPSSPQLGLALSIACLLGLVSGIGAGAVIETFDDGLSNAEDVERKTGKPAIATIPLVREVTLSGLEPGQRNPPGYLVEKPMSAFAEGFRALRAAFLYSEFDRPIKVVALTSALPGEGKTTSSICLARVAALSGQKVLLVDCDLRRRSLNEVLNLAPERGLLQVLKGEAHWRSVLLDDPATGVQILPAATVSVTARDVFGSQAMSNLMSELRAEYDLIVLDCPPVLAVIDAKILSRHADETVVVAKWAKTAPANVKHTIQQLESSGGHVLGVALNKVNPNAPGHATYGSQNYQAKYARSYYTS